MSNKLLNINKLKIRNGTRKGTRTCPYGTIFFYILSDSLSSSSSYDSSETSTDDSSGSGTSQKPLDNWFLYEYIYAEVNKKLDKTKGGLAGKEIEKETKH